ncbi:restriction endonuclease [Bacillus alveayuensis]|uniref:restriction endonuclease n=1 Tax=Aeribacillus alveayuensis TaxID=279215 RepID=UPI0006960034|nr:restriction endonuclease [Bacillus alveayuensis]
MGKRRRKSIRTKVRLEYLFTSIMWIFVIFLVIVQILMEVFKGIISFFKHLDVLGWVYVFIACGGFLLLFGMVRSYEKRIAKERKIQRMMLHEQWKKKQLEAKKRELEKIKEQSTLEQLKLMDPHEFERFVKLLFEWMGYQAELTPRTGDGGKDIILQRNGEKSLVECKRYNKSKVTRPDVQKFHSALMDCHATKGYYVTTGEFTQPARDYCADKPIDLINGEKLVKMLRSIVNEKEKVIHNNAFNKADEEVK